MTQALAPVGDVGAGHVLGRYELLLPIASGGMAMVWAARLKGTRGFQKIVAVKTMLPKLTEDEQFEQMFLDEASLASQIRHPHVVEILDLGEQDGVLFLVMEWIDGVPLNQLMKAAKKVGGIPLSAAVRICIQACAGLHAAHELKDREGQLVGLVHRDVSPQNVLVTYDGVTKVVDFGVAKATALNDGMTAAGQIKGKVAYMAPEQVKGAAIDRRVDVFAMGIVLYALTTGKHPFRRESEAATMYNIASPSPVVPPRSVVPDYPAELEAVLLQALAKDPDKRFATANDMLKALDALPAQLRSSTDDDVGKFVRKLFSDRREERRTALAKALENADRQAENRLTLRQMMGEAERPSQATMIAGLEVTPSGGRPIAAAHGSHSGLTGTDVHSVSNLTEIDPDFGKGERRRRLVAGGAGVLLLGAAAAVWMALSSDPEPGPAEAPPTTAAAPPARAVEPARVAPEPPVANDDIKDIDDLPEVEPTSDAPGTSTESPHSGRAPPPKRRPPRTSRPPPTKPATPPPPASSATPAQPSWKHDPGF